MDFKAVLIKKLLNLYDTGEVNTIVRYYFLDRFDLKLGTPISLTKDQQEVFESDLQRFELFEPYQYIVGRSYFYNRPFAVNNHTLIPRPETEELVYSCIQFIQKRTSKSFKVLEIGTGSGCIAISLSLESNRNLKITAIDISQQALDIARDNLISLNAEVELIKMDFLEESKWLELGMFDIIISNPPYISLAEINAMNDNVLGHEPHIALFSEDPLLFYKKIAKFSSLLARRAIVFCEINPLFVLETKNIFLDYGFTDVKVIDDMQNKPRILIAN